MNELSPVALTAKDFASDQEVRWCPGCGDYAILKAVQKALAELGARPERTVFVSGIGCSSRFPYYLATYGVHGIHGRAPALATGIKLANPELDVWVVTGDGDGLSIGGNHLLHVLRRNLDVQILLFNNEVYGLTKGQYSPTSPVGLRTPSTPMGSVDNPVSPCAFALGAGARFIARAVDTKVKELVDVLKDAHGYTGASFVEIFQNCIVYYDEAFAAFTAREVAADRQLFVRHGEPLRFGTDGSKGLRLNPRSLALEVVEVDVDGVSVDDLLVHDETNRALATLLIDLRPPAFPMVLGVIYRDQAPVFDRQVHAQIDAARAKAGAASDGADGDQDPHAVIERVLNSGPTWTVG